MQIHLFPRLILFALPGVLLTPLSLAGEDTESALSAILEKMSVEEKVGQMTQLTLGALSSSESNSGDPDGHELDPDKLRNAIVKKHVGSVLNVHNMAFSVTHWHKILTQIQDLATRQDQRNEFGRQGRKFVLEHYAEHVVAEAHRRFYASLLEGSKVRAAA